MSFAALAWASKYRANSAAEKLVLFAYADRHNEDTGSAYPSLVWLAEFTSLNRKTIIAAIAKLEEAGVLSDTGERMGATKQIKVYHLAMETVPKTEQFQKRNSTENGRKQSQKRDTDTVRNLASAEASLPPKQRASKPKSAHFRLPRDWKPTRFTEGSVSRAIIDRRGIEWGRAALESFRNWAANADDKPGIGRKLDWQAAWSKWVIEQDRREGRNGTLQPHSGQGLRGSRPDPALDMYRDACRREAEEGASGDPAADFGARISLPSYLTS